MVYMAEQREPVRRRVALKVIKPRMAPEVLARFEAGRQALARAEHPNIAKVLNAGTTEDGRPYFVMEAVLGIPLTQYCELHELSVEARLGLFVQVCLAIQHAHELGLIHGDIKPANILLANIEPGSPMTPKIIGFDMMEGTTDQSLADENKTTAFGGFGGNPAYISPEHTPSSGAPIDSRSDIYSLGAVLYELLTSRTPFESRRLAKAGVDEFRRMVAQEVPSLPSTRLHALDAAVRMEVARQRRTQPPELLQRLRGDLDWIVMKCLEKDPARRYETAGELARDIQRHLGNEPVSVRPPARASSLQKTIGLLQKVGLMWLA
jgi:serine/threonine protein kinase